MLKLRGIHPAERPAAIQRPESDQDRAQDHRPREGVHGVNHQTSTTRIELTTGATPWTNQRNSPMRRS